MAGVIPVESDSGSTEKQEVIDFDEIWFWLMKNTNVLVFFEVFEKNLLQTYSL
jgi:hypothetical protein